MIRFYITRHGLTQWNKEGRLQGRQNSPLLESGIEDARDLKAYLSDVSFSAVYSSPVERAYYTASTIFGDQVIKDDRLREMSFGIYEGKKVSDIAHLKEYQDLWDHPGDFTRFEDGESYQEVKDRLLDFVEEMIHTKEGNIFVCLHGMCFVVMMSIFMDIPIEKLNMLNQHIVRGCSLTTVSYDGTFHVEKMGDTHFLHGVDQNIEYK